jgi:hypothetical protein
LTFTNGTYTIRGEGFSSGIGAGSVVDEAATTVRSIIIEDGNYNITTVYGAGIGAGYGAIGTSSVGMVNISEGVFRVGSAYGAAIGTGAAFDGGNSSWDTVTISNGDFIVSSEHGAAIGTGHIESDGWTSMQALLVGNGSFVVSGQVGFGSVRYTDVDLLRFAPETPMSLNRLWINCTSAGSCMNALSVEIEDLPTNAVALSPKFFGRDVYIGSDVPGEPNTFYCQFEGDSVHQMITRSRMIHFGTLQLPGNGSCTITINSYHHSPIELTFDPAKYQGLLVHADVFVQTIEFSCPAAGNAGLLCWDGDKSDFGGDCDGECFYQTVAPCQQATITLTPTLSQTSAPADKSWIIGVAIGGAGLLTGALVLVVVVIWKKKHSQYTELERSELTGPLDKV